MGLARQLGLYKFIDLKMANQCIYSKQAPKIHRNASNVVSIDAIEVFPEKQLRKKVSLLPYPNKCLCQDALGYLLLSFVPQTQCGPLGIDVKLHQQSSLAVFSFHLSCPHQP